MAIKRKRIIFQVIPDIGLREEHVQFDLGLPLNMVLNMLDQNVRIFPNVSLTFSKKVNIYLILFYFKLFRTRTPERFGFSLKKWELPSFLTPSNSSSNT